MLRSRDVFESPAGNSIDVAVDWKTKAGVPEVPSAVRYQVFDGEDPLVPVSAEVSVSGLAASMVITVAGTDLPGRESPLARRLVQLQAEFGGPTDIHTVTVPVDIARVAPFGGTP